MGKQKKQKDLISVDLINRAYDLFMKHEMVHTIAAQLSIDPIALSGIVRKRNWEEERKFRDKSVFDAYTQKKGAMMARIGDLSLTLITRSLEERMNDKRPIELPEARLISDIFTSLDKVIKLDAGEATERVEHIGKFTIQDVHDAIAMDKFFIDVTPTELINATSGDGKPQRRGS